MFCTKCGNKLADDARFCTKCGNAVNTATVPNTPPPTGTFSGVTNVSVGNHEIIDVGSLSMEQIAKNNKAVTQPQQVVPPQQQAMPRKKLPLKPFIIAGASLIVITVVLMSVLLFSSGVDVYACCFDGEPAYWKNGELIRLENPVNRSKKFSIYVSGNDVYVCGTVSTVRVGNFSSWRLDEDGVYQYPNHTAVYWKNGELLELPGDYSNAEVESIYVSGNDVYVCGRVDSKAVYWKNGELVKLSDDNSRARSIYVSGNDVYVCGSGGDKAVYWKNGKTIELGGSYASSIYVSGNDVYICGGVDSKAVYWKNGKLVELGIGSTNSMYVSGNNVFVSGYDYIDDYNHIDDDSGSYYFKERAVYWKNGKLVALPGDDTWALSIYVYLNNVYIGGSSNGNIVLWKNNKVARTYEAGMSISSVFVKKK